jgi:enamine deaminase RidA (YjgF/YER057c/UK114 family)
LEPAAPRRAPRAATRRKPCTSISTGRRTLQRRAPTTDVAAGARPEPQRRRISSGSPYEALLGLSRAVRAGGSVFVSATAPIWPDGRVDEDVAAQARRCLEIIGEALAQAGGSLRDVVRTRVYLVDRGDGEAVGAVHAQAFGESRPASGFIVVSGFLDPRWRVEIEADAVLAGSAAVVDGEERDRDISPPPEGREDR